MGMMNKIILWTNMAIGEMLRQTERTRVRYSFFWDVNNPSLLYKNYTVEMKYYSKSILFPERGGETRKSKRGADIIAYVDVTSI